MIGAIIGSALGAASSIYGGWKASQAAKEAKNIENKNYQAQSQKNQNWYDRRYNEDGTQRADAQRLLSMTREAMRNRNKAANGAAAVSGASEESVANAKAQSAQAMADATANVAAMAEQRKDNIENAYNQRQQGLDDAHTRFGVAIEQQKANNIIQAANGVSGAVSRLGMGIDGAVGAKDGGGSGSGTTNDTAQTAGAPTGNTLSGDSGFTTPKMNPYDESYTNPFYGQSYRNPLK